jgi:hypothetical protein
MIQFCLGKAILYAKVGRNPAVRAAGFRGSATFVR